VIIGEDPEVKCVMSVEVLRSRGDQKVLGCLVCAYTMNIELCGSWIYYECYCISFARTLWVLNYLVHAYSLIIGFSGLYICYEYCIIGIMHRLRMLYSRSLQRSSLRLKSAATLRSIAECAIPDVAKGCVTFFTVKQFRPCGLLDP
jgi:hypothetical protein